MLDVIWLACDALAFARRARCSYPGVQPSPMGRESPSGEPRVLDTGYSTKPPTTTAPAPNHRATGRAGRRFEAGRRKLEPQSCILPGMRYANGTPLMKWWASGLLVLALSPFTAPFQTVDLGRLLSGENDETALITPLTEMLTSVADDDDDAGSLIAPVGTELRLEPPFGIAVPAFVVTPRVAFLQPSVASIACISAQTSPPTPLRL
jgi:hypothetical protein